MSHTPGPWTIERDPHAIVVEDLSENTVCEFTVDTPDDIAFYKDVESTIRPILPAEAEANAKLFLAAPDMLVALKALRHRDTDCWCDVAIGHPLTHEHSYQCRLAREAVAKAEDR